MPPKKDPDATPGVKLLRMFRKLMLDGRYHFQIELAKELQCSSQTIIRLAAEIESVIGINLDSGVKDRRRWYQIRTISRSRLGLDFEELRYLSICRDLAAISLPEPVLKRIDASIFNLSLLMADQDFSNRQEVQQQQFAFFSKGRIDYTPFHEIIEKLVDAKDSQRICLVRYKASGKQDEKEHRFVPSQIVSMSNTLYVLGACLTEDFKEVRHYINLAIHRITDITLTEKAFSMLIPQASPASFGLPWHEPKAFRIQFTAGKAAEYVRERIWADKQSIKELKNGGLILELTTTSEPELMAWVRSFGAHAECMENNKLDANFHTA